MVAKIKHAAFKFVTFTVKQKKILTWWISDVSPYSDADGIICDGAVRSGKTVIMSFSYIVWLMQTYNYSNFGMAGKTIGSFRRNVLFTLKLILKARGYKVKDHRSDNYLVISKTIDGEYKENYIYIFGGKDEKSQDLVQGFTSAGFFFDEVALMPESFVNQAVARCSIEGRKLWFNCNPEGPLHWFYLEWILKKDIKNLYRLQFNLDDNPSLSKTTKDFLKRMFTGVFYQRFILGLWVVASGIIYDMFSDKNTYETGDTQNGPDLSLYYNRYITIDYGTTNPCVFLEVIEQNKICYIDNEYYFDSKAQNKQKSDDEYLQDLLEFIGDKRYKLVIIDPSAASFKLICRQKGLRVKEADNDVLDGIRLVSSLFNMNTLRVNRRCKNVLKEVQSYVWDSKAAEKGNEKPVKENDHAMDAIRYYCKTIIKHVFKSTLFTRNN